MVLTIIALWLDHVYMWGIPLWLKILSGTVEFFFWICIATLIDG